MKKLMSFFGVFAIVTVSAFAGVTFTTEEASEAAAPPPAANPPFTVLAAAPRSTVFSPTTNNNTNSANGSQWYYRTDGASMGFAPGGQSVQLSSADVLGSSYGGSSEDATTPYRLSWHTGSNTLNGGWRAGGNYSLGSGWTRYIYEASTLPDYYPSGPQINVSQSALDGWTLCFSNSYGTTGTLLSSIESACNENYILVAGGPDTVGPNVMDIERSNESVLDGIGGSQEDNVVVGDTLEPVIYEGDETTVIDWNDYVVYRSDCSVYECSMPNDPIADPSSWGPANHFEDDYTVDIEDSDYYLAFAPADDSTLEAVDDYWVIIEVDHEYQNFQIDNCEALQELINIPGAFLDDITLDDNINCEGINFSPLDWEEPFQGEFDGDGFEISNLDIDPGTAPAGLFSEASGANLNQVTISNATVSAPATAGILVGQAINTEISDVHVSGDVATVNEVVGGLAGIVTTQLGTSSIERSSSAGTVTGASYVGGLVGIIDNFGGTLLTTQNYSTSSVSGSGGNNFGGLFGGVYIQTEDETSDIDVIDSYAHGDVNAPTSGNVGGLIGSTGTGSTFTDTPRTIEIQRTYASGDVSGDSNVGGLVGRVNDIAQDTVLEIADSFSVSSIDANETYGGVVGDFLGTIDEYSFNNNYWDVTTSGVDSCVDTDVTPTCYGVNSDGSEGDYFVNTISREPLDGWMFGDIWQRNSTALPDFVGDDSDLDGISTEEEDAGPNDGDANADGTPDSSQDFVASFMNEISGGYSVLVAPDDCVVLSVGISSQDDFEVSDSEYEYLAGLMNFVIDCFDPGVAASVQHLHYGVENISDVMGRKFIASTSEFIDLPDAEIAAFSIDGQSGISMTFVVTDGEERDADGEANGVIEDPAGIVQEVPVVPQEETASGVLPSTGSEVLDASLLALVLIVGGLVVIVHQRSKTRAAHTS